MRGRPSAAFVVVAAVLGAAILFALAWSPAAVTPGDHPDRSRARPGPAVPAAPDSAIPPRLRNLFLYEEPSPPPFVAGPPASVAPVSVPPPLTLPPPSPVVLVGFVRQGSAVRAALSIHGDVSVLAKDQSADGYLVLSIDEDRGVTVRAPDGSELTLQPSER
jgi:hypothetical protein